MTITSNGLVGHGPIRVLIVHCAYQQRGGEDSVVEAEVALLKRHGHDVELLLRHNDDVAGMSYLDVGTQAVWSRQSARLLRDRIESFRPDVIHVHNTLPLISPSVFWEGSAAHIPVVHTLHNFRLLCPQATFLRNGAVCEDCLGQAPWPGVLHRCYRESMVQSGVVAGMLMVHRALGTYQRKVTRYIALNEFCKSKFVAGGIPAGRIDIKPNFVDWVPEPQWHTRSGGLYVGRLSVEKGVTVLTQAMTKYPAHRVEVIGAGPFEADVKAAAQEAYLGPQPLACVLERLSRAAYLVLPSVCYEGFPRTLVEAFASGVPVIASRHGSLQELIEDGQTGLLFEPGNVDELVAKLQWADEHPQEMARMGRLARRAYEQRYAPERNHEQLIAIYRQAMADARA
jgi:glycosyltransferase involved in cell wall biosynthesis